MTLRCEGEGASIPQGRPGGGRDSSLMGPPTSALAGGGGDPSRGLMETKGRHAPSPLASSSHGGWILYGVWSGGGAWVDDFYCKGGNGIPPLSGELCLPPQLGGGGDGVSLGGNSGGVAGGYLSGGG